MHLCFFHALWRWLLNKLLVDRLHIKDYSYGKLYGMLYVFGMHSMWTYNYIAMITVALFQVDNRMQVWLYFLMKQVKYKRWLLWSRFLMLIMVLQFVAATYLVFVVAKHLHLGRASSNCVLGNR